ncbi:MAG: T9SS type A sorting domain-containing protein [Bacteroidales bacterium]
MKKVIFFLILFGNFLLTFSQTQSKLNFCDTTQCPTITFDSVCNYIHIDTSSQNLWQIGHPQKIFFDSAYSNPLAIVTDTVNNYPINNHSYFDLYIGDFNFDSGYYGDMFIGFWHKFGTDTLKDGCYITVSWDKGLTWINVINDSIYQGDGTPGDGFFCPSNIYSSDDVLFNGENGFSGHSNGWIHTIMQWYIMPCKKTFPPDTMIIRFNFISDSINNSKEGWMIDNISLCSYDLGDGISDINFKGNSISIYPNPFSTQSILHSDNPLKSAILTVYNVYGQAVKTIENINGQSVTISRDYLQKGIYFLQLIQEKKIIATEKLIFSD